MTQYKTLKELLDAIKEDSEFSQTKLDVETSRIPYLHAKWLGILMEERSAYQDADTRVKKVYKEKYDYYLGKAPIDVYIERPFDVKVLKADLHVYIDSDEEYAAVLKEREIASAKIDAVSDFVKQIHARQWHIRNIIEWNKFTQGDQI